MVAEQMLLFLLGISAPMYAFVKARSGLIGVVIGAASALAYAQAFGFDVNLLAIALSVFAGVLRIVATLFS